MIDVMRKAVLVPIHRDGWPFIAAFALDFRLPGLARLRAGRLARRARRPHGASTSSATPSGWRRDARQPRGQPGRRARADDPAGACRRPSSAWRPAPLTRVSIFLNVFDVHVNRVPADGVVTRLRLPSGKFFNAALDKASEDNERQSVRMTHCQTAASVAFVQIAGLVARRIRLRPQGGAGRARGRAVRPDPLRQPRRRLPAARGRPLVARRPAHGRRARP